jgi:predicted RND superfamily exporter protein
MSSATGRGILVAALTTIIGFATLMISQHEGMFGLGLVLSLGVTCCMFAALIVLPAVLRLLDRKLPAHVETTTKPLAKAA